MQADVAPHSIVPAEGRYDGFRLVFPGDVLGQERKLTNVLLSLPGV
jgi:hypothetical protein